MQVDASIFYSCTFEEIVKNAILTLNVFTYIKNAAKTHKNTKNLVLHEFLEWFALCCTKVEEEKNKTNSIYSSKYCLKKIS